MIGTVINRTASACKRVYKATEMTQDDKFDPTKLSVVNPISAGRKRAATAIIVSAGAGA